MYLLGHVVIQPRLAATAPGRWRRGQGGLGVAGNWRIRHKLMLSMGLMVSVLALLLVGTLKGLASYRTTMRTIGSKMDELEEADKLRAALEALTKNPRRQNDDIDAQDRPGPRGPRTLQGQAAGARRFPARCGLWLQGTRAARRSYGLARQPEGGPGQSWRAEVRPAGRYTGLALRRLGPCRRSSTRSCAPRPI